ncbi:MAG: cob(I)yrinic acid a,c-diamide adenosyltransferase [Candidatus Nanohaloarchaea archaeon]|nr:cob(I)yrinic acid a,c-diamide adenosyltransferase [Candidatus Nanohaloarchaea archaeon]
MTIYTRRGDGGRTDLHSGERIPKDTPRIEAVGTVDELNTVIGRALSHLDDEEVGEVLRDIQNDLHVCQTDLANTDRDADHPRMEQERIDRLETVIDRFEEGLPELQDFILQGGTPAAAALYNARAVCRRAERRTVALADTEEVNESVIGYLNRLSDTLFVLARTVNHRNGIDERHPSY